MPDDFEAEMAAISTVYGFRPGRVLTQEDWDALQLYEKVNRRDEGRATDAFHDGYMQGLREGGSADIEEMRKRMDDQFCRHGVDKAMRKLAEDRCDTLRRLLSEAVEAYAAEVGEGGPDGFVSRARKMLPSSEANPAKAEPVK